MVLGDVALFHQYKLWLMFLVFVLISGVVIEVTAFKIRKEIPKTGSLLFILGLILILTSFFLIIGVFVLDN